MKTVSLLLLGMLACLVTCPQRTSASAEPRLKIVCSTTQTADLTRQIVGDRCEVVCLLGPGVNPHVYQPVPNDSRLVESADLCVQNGLHLEGKNWMASLAKDNGNKPLVSATEGVQPLDLEYEGEIIKDPHAWFDPRNAALYINNILRGIVELDPDGEDLYRARADLYLQQLRVLDAWITKQVSRIPAPRRILVTSHDAFNYYAARYGFKVRSPVGWSTGSEIGGGMTPARRRGVAQSIRDFNVPAIFVETSVNPKMIRQISEEAGVAIGGELYSDAMGEAGSAGEAYIGMMRENTLTIVEALARLMRFLASLLIAAALLGSVAWCQFHLTRDVAFDVTREAHGHGEEVVADGHHTYRLEVLFSFAAERDPFALQTTQDSNAARLSVQHAGSMLIERTDDIPRGEAVHTSELAFPGDQVDLFIQATPSVEAARHPCALRVMLYRNDGALCDDTTLWSDGNGAHVSGAVTLSLEPRLATLDRGLGGSE